MLPTSDSTSMITFSYIKQNMTKHQTSEHKQLIGVLKQRKSNGENNLIIRNGAVTTRRPRAQNSNSRNTTAPSPTEMDS